MIDMLTLPDHHHDSPCHDMSAHGKPSSMPGGQRDVAEPRPPVGGRLVCRVALADHEHRGDERDHERAVAEEQQRRVDPHEPRVVVELPGGLHALIGARRRPGRPSPSPAGTATYWPTSPGSGLGERLAEKRPADGENGGTRTARRDSSSSRWRRIEQPHDGDDQRPHVELLGLDPQGSGDAAAGDAGGGVDDHHELVELPVDPRRARARRR